MSKYANLYWFNNFKPDISIENGKVDGYVKNLIMEEALKINEGIYIDPIISKIIEAEVYYINLLSKKIFINYANKNCGLNINIYTQNLEVILEDGKKYIFVESKKSHGSNLIAHCLQAQLYYNFRNHYLQGNSYRTPAEFTKKFYEPIADEIVDFLK